MTVPGTESATRLVDELLLSTDGPKSWGLPAIAREPSLLKAVVHRTPQTSIDRQRLVVDTGARGYKLGPATAAALCARALRESGLRSAALPALHPLQQLTGGTTTASALISDGRVCLGQVESGEQPRDQSNHELKMSLEVGRHPPLHACRSSVCIPAFFPEQQQTDVLNGPLTALTNRTVTDRGMLAKRLEEIRHVGYAHSDGERQAGAGAVAAPVFGLGGTALAGMPPSRGESS